MISSINHIQPTSNIKNFSEFQLLPAEICIKIFEYLKIEHQTNCRMVCNTWNFLLDDKKYWEKVAFKLEVKLTHGDNPKMVVINAVNWMRNPLGSKDLTYFKTLNQKVYQAIVKLPIFMEWHDKYLDFSNFQNLQMKMTENIMKAKTSNGNTAIIILKAQTQTDGDGNIVRSFKHQVYTLNQNAFLNSSSFVVYYTWRQLSILEDDFSTTIATFYASPNENMKSQNKKLEDEFLSS